MILHLISAYYFHQSDDSIAIAKKNMPDGKYNLEYMIKKNYIIKI